jgi:hypothetical protein
MSWNTINNAQLPGWVDVLRPVAVTIEETAVFGGSNFGSVAFASSITTSSGYDPASTAWLQANNGQTPNWQNTSNAQSPTWANIDDTQTPGWTPINT